MKFTLRQQPVWNGGILPKEINVVSSHPIISEFELLAIICTLHGHVTAFDILMGAEPNSEKDTDINAVMTAFQMYIYPKMPNSNYSSNDKRINAGELTAKPIDGKN